ncbi:hypothetical protein ACMGGR_18270 [Erwinia sp. BNK-24-b]|uniref:hypothetical protein n=1 Tax=unclassified Erwinia TaxID=2622719 RepID=UPI0039BF67F9
MKRVLLSLALFTNVAAASPHLVAADADTFTPALAEKALSLDIAGAEPFGQQTFAVRDNGHLLGVMVPGKGLLRADMNACFIGWSRDGESLANLLPTIGFERFNGEACEDVKGVGVISPPGDNEVKIAVIYTATTLVETSLVAVVLAYDPQSRSLVVDNALSQRVNDASMDSIAKIRRFYATHPESTGIFDSPKYIARITTWCEEGNLDCDDVTLDSKSKISGKSIFLHGSTVNVNCPDVCDFRGYKFENNGYLYYFVDNDVGGLTLDIFKDGKVIDSVDGTLR